MARRRMVYEGKAKILYEGPEPGTLVQYFKDDATAFNAEKKGSFEGKGLLNREISNLIFAKLSAEGIPTHFVQSLSEKENLVEAVEIILLEGLLLNSLIAL